MTTNHIKTDIIIIGAGIAGLWLHHRLNDLGYHAILLEKDSIGGVQTLSAQGIIHGGAKYTLNGILSPAASAIAGMPSRWLSCLKNKGEINLSDTKILSDHQLMWSTQNISSKITSFFASKALSDKITPLNAKKYPEPFKNSLFKGNLYQLNEPVIDIPSLVKNLSKKWRHRILKTDGKYAFFYKKDGNVNSITINQQLTIKANEIILTAGEGNQGLLKHLSIQTPAMQRRPLQMLLAKSSHLPTLFAHCVGSSSKPIATITTHKHSDGDSVWYIGGNIAEEGINLHPDKLIQQAQKTLQTILPWINTDNVEWATHKVNRAEPAQKNRLRPDTAFVESTHNIHIAWPTKLALTPNLSDKVIKAIKENNITAIPQKEQQITDTLLGQLPTQHQISLLNNLWERSFNANT